MLGNFIEIVDPIVSTNRAFSTTKVIVIFKMFFDTRGNAQTQGNRPTLRTPEVPISADGLVGSSLEAAPRDVDSACRGSIAGTHVPAPELEFPQLDVNRP